MEAAFDTPTPGRAKEASSSDDRVWAALAHASAFLMFVGPLVPMIMWVMNRRKSPYVAFQALQAMLYQSVFFWAWFSILPLVLFIFMFVWTALSVPLIARSANPMAIIFVPEMVLVAVMFGSFLLYGLVGVGGAVACLMGRDFKYPFMGEWAARYLGYTGQTGSALEEGKEDRIVAATSHSTAMILFFGILTPITAWITQHERSAFLRFQAMQAAIYQGIGVIGYFALMVLSMVFTVGMFGLMGVTAYSHSSSTPPAWVAASMLPFIGVMCALELAIPLYHLFAFLGTVRVLRGHNFHYPILGQILAGRMKPGEAK